MFSAEYSEVVTKITRLLAMSDDFAKNGAYTINFDVWMRIREELRAQGVVASKDLDCANVTICGVPLVIRFSDSDLFSDWHLTINAPNRP